MVAPQQRGKPFPHVTCASVLLLAMLALFLHEDLFGMLRSDEVLAAASGDALDGVSAVVVRDHGVEGKGDPSQLSTTKKHRGGDTTAKQKKRDMSEEEKEDARVKKCNKWRVAASAGKAEAFEGELDDEPRRGAAAGEGVTTTKEKGTTKMPSAKKYCHAKKSFESHCYSAPVSKLNSRSVRPYRGMHKGQSAVLFCTGPTMVRRGGEGSGGEPRGD